MSDRIDELRRLLRERGVECYQRNFKYGSGVGWTDSSGYLVSAEQWHDALLVQALLTPEQAVDVTVGRETCHDTGEDPMRFMCSACGGVEGETLPNYCPSCGRKVV